jgi:hypothetical protein
VRNVAATQEGWRSHAFGLALDSDFGLVGCPSDGSPPGMPRVSIAIDDPRSILDSLGSAAVTVIARRRNAAGRWIAYVKAHHTRGYLLHAPRAAVFHISASGDRVRCAPRQVPVWRWQRSLVGEALPFVSALRGLETLHASCVIVPGAHGAIGIVGASGAGKTSVAAGLLLSGATFLADDVLALRRCGVEVVAHPGPGLMSLRDVTVRRIGAANVDRIGERVGGDEAGLRLAVPRHGAPVPLTGLYLLEIAPGSRSVDLVPQPAPDLRTLLGTTFNFALLTPKRLIAQLEVCAGIAAAVGVIRVLVPPGVDHQTVAARILAHATRRAAAGVGAGR